MSTSPNKPSRSLLTVEDTRSRLERVLIVRLDPSLRERVDAAIRETPALSGVSRSEFVRRALILAVDSLAEAKGHG
jgi:metal-responsive CopG/Arc/MetJ family transcriptional regulator